MSAEKPTLMVEDNPAEARYEMHVDGELAGAIHYQLDEPTIAFVHTEIAERFEGRGLGSQLARESLDDTRRRGLRILPSCPFVRSYIARHQEYLDLVPEEERAAFAL